MNGKIKTQTQSGQQKETCPLENQAQNKLTTDKVFIGGWMRKRTAPFTQKHIYA